jgi:hypothetical protein
MVPIHVKQKSKAKAEPSVPREPKSIETESVERKATKAALSSREQRKGVSSGLSTVTRRRMKAKGGVGGTKVKWWSELAGTKGSSKGHVSVTV